MHVVGFWHRFFFFFVLKNGFPGVEARRMEVFSDEESSHTNTLGENVMLLRVM